MEKRLVRGLSQEFPDASLEAIPKFTDSLLLETFFIIAQTQPEFSGESVPKENHFPLWQPRSAGRGVHLDRLQVLVLIDPTEVSQQRQVDQGTVWSFRYFGIRAVEGAPS